MSAKERIGLLQGLLSRVQTRAQEPRTNGGAYAPVTALAADDGASDGTSDGASEPQAFAKHESLPPDTAHGQDMAAYAAASDSEHRAESDDDLDADVEVSTETVEVDIDIDEPGYDLPEAEAEAAIAQSGAQPVAQPTMPPDELEEVDEEEPRAAAQPSVPPAAATAPPPANEIEEEAPSSSRRPIAGEETSDTYAAESAPRHTPPPESGKQVASPSVHPAARQTSEPSFEREEASVSLNPSAPPPSLEGHTLIGGWREPGLGGPQIGAGLTTGVRVPAPPPGPAAAPPAQASGTRLSPDVTRPEVAASADVARFEGAGASVPKPSTMGELLDLTLSL